MAASKETINFCLAKILVHDDPDANILHNTVVIVPTKFLIVDNANNNALYVRYLNPPYKDEDVQLLSSLTSRNDLHAPDSWPLFKAEIVTVCGTYEQALEKLQNLECPVKAIPSVKEKSDPSTTKTQQLFDVPEFVNDSPNLISQEEMETNSLGVVQETVENMVEETVEETVEEVVGDIAEEMIEDTVEKNIKNVVQGTLPQSAIIDNQKSQNVLDFSQFITKQDLVEFEKKILEELKKMTNEITTCFNDVKEKVVDVQAKVLTMERDVQQIKTYVMENRPFRDQENIIQLDKIQEVYEVELTLSNYDDFKVFDGKIIGDSYTILKNYFNCNINTKETNILIKVLTPIFKDFFSKELLMLFTAQKKNKDKPIFKNTNFFKCLLEAMQHAYNTPDELDKMTDKSLSVLIGALINNAPDWHGGRDKRRRTEDLA